MTEPLYTRILDLGDEIIRPESVVCESCGAVVVGQAKYLTAHNEWHRRAECWFDWHEGAVGGYAIEPQ